MYGVKFNIKEDKPLLLQFVTLDNANDAADAIWQAVNVLKQPIVFDSENNGNISMFMDEQA